MKKTILLVWFQAATWNKVRAELRVCTPGIAQAADVAQAMQGHMPDVPGPIDLWVQRQLQVAFAHLLCAIQL